MTRRQYRLAVAGMIGLVAFNTVLMVVLSGVMGR